MPDEQEQPETYVPKPPPNPDPHNPSPFGPDPNGPQNGDPVPPHEEA